MNFTSRAPLHSTLCGIAASLALAMSFSVSAESGCPQHYSGDAPHLVNQKLRQNTRELCALHFAVLHSGVTRTPIYTAEALTRETVGDAKEQIRYNNFHPDPRLPANERSELRDYARSGYDRGHMAPSGDMPTLEAQQESFALSNMIPQNPQNNRYLWAGIESTTRQLAKKSARLYVISGAMFVGERIKTVGGRVMVPTHLFKAIYNPKTGEAAAYLVRNDVGGDYAVVDLATLETLSGIRTFPSAKFRVAEMALLAPVVRGSKSGHYGRVDAKTIMAVGTVYSPSSAASKRLPGNAMTSSSHPLVARYATTVLKRLNHFAQL